MTFGWTPRTPEQRLKHLLSRTVETEDGCWLFQGATSKAGYGTAWNGERVAYVHRHVYELMVGPIEDGLMLDHLCRRTKCCNPAHLEPVTNAENIRRIPRGETCRNGHPRTPENWYVAPKTGHRDCLPCRKERDLGRVR